jgi:hypothetical protein
MSVKEGARGGTMGSPTIENIVKAVRADAAA